MIIWSIWVIFNALVWGGAAHACYKEGRISSKERIWVPIFMLAITCLIPFLILA